MEAEVMEQADATLPIMLGTAGHVDHGKTTLVRRLTGFETDRHPEEKSRGMSIDFAVAPMQTSSGVLGIIDVPGHEDFIRNMVAGATAVDLVLLVVAADDGVMPQTREHAIILRHLGVAHFIVVVTKCDLVSSEQVELVEDEANNLLRTLDVQPLAAVRMFATNQQGIDELRLLVEKFIVSYKRNPDTRAFRMSVRAVFSMKGHGTVVTGVPMSGSVSTGDSLQLLPSGNRVILRGIQNYRTVSTHTSAHVSSALNIRELDLESVRRGDTLIQPGAYENVLNVLCVLRNIDSKHVLSRRGELRCHFGTFAGSCSYRLLDVNELAPNCKSFAYVKFTEPMALTAGDRLLFRVHSPQKTVGAAVILGTNVGRLRTLTTPLLDRLVAAEESLLCGDNLASELYSRHDIIYSTETLTFLSHCSQNQHPQGTETSARDIDPLTARRPDGTLLSLGAETWVFSARLAELHDRFKRMLRRYHHANALTWGMKPSLVAELLHVPQEAYKGLEPILLRDPEIAVKHGRLALTEFTPQISPREIKLREQCLAEITKANIQSISRGDLQKLVGISDQELKAVVRLLVDEGLVKVLDQSLLLAERYEQFKKLVLELFERKPILELSRFREVSGLSRNLATLVLDSFDSAGITKRVPEGRVLIK